MLIALLLLLILFALLGFGAHVLWIVAVVMLCVLLLAAFTSR